MATVPRMLLVPVFVAVCLAAVSCSPDRSMEYPKSWPSRLLGVQIDQAKPSDIAVPVEAAVWQARRTLFLGAGPPGEPHVFPIRVTGTIAKGQRRAGGPGPSPGTTLKVADKAALLVVWQRVTRADIAPPGMDAADEPPTARIDVVVLVDGDLGDVLGALLLSDEAALPTL